MNKAGELILNKAYELLRNNEISHYKFTYNCRKIIRPTI